MKVQDRMPSGNQQQMAPTERIDTGFEPMQQMQLQQLIQQMMSPQLQGGQAALGELLAPMMGGSNGPR